MEIIRLTAPAFPALTDAELVSWLRIDADQDTETLTMLVGSATEYVEGLTGRCLGLSTYQVALDGIDECYRLPLAPIQSVTKVEYRDVAGVLQPITNYMVDQGTLILAAYAPGFPIVTLTAGYADTDAIPEALRHAVAVLVSAGYNGREEVSDATMKTVERLCQRHKRFVW